MPNTTRLAEVAPTTYLTNVVRSTMVTPRVRRVTFGGSWLARFPEVGADEFVYLLLPPAGRTELTIGPGFEWSDVRGMPRDERPRGAYYSVRHHRPELQEIDLDIVVHDGGAASSWAVEAGPGDPAALWGPRILFKPPADTEWCLLVADDTAVPAMLAILEHLPETVSALAVAEVSDAAEVRVVENRVLEGRPQVDLRWVCRDQAVRSACQIVRGLDLPPGRGYAWGGGEHEWIQELDAVVAGTHGLGSDQRSLTSYWRRGTATGLG